MKVVITIPAFNEERTIGGLIKEIKQVMNRYNYKILVVDDGSKDKTALVAKQHGALVYSHPINYGLADTFNTEIEKSLEIGADIIVHIDADGQYLPKEIPKLIEEIKNGCDLVLGSRFRGKIESMPWLKKAGNKAFSKVVSNITRIKITDAQTGFRAFNKGVAEKVKITSTYTYTQEQIIRAARAKFRIKEVPIYFAKRRDNSRLMKNPFDFAVKAGVNLLRIYRDYEPLKFFGGFGALFIGVGFLIGLWLVYLFLTTGVVGHLPSLILSMLLIIVGMQIIFFGFLADMRKQ